MATLVYKLCVLQKFISSIYQFLKINLMDAEIINIYCRSLIIFDNYQPEKIIALALTLKVSLDLKLGYV